MYQHVFRKDSPTAQHIIGNYSLKNAEKRGLIIPVGHRWYSTEPLTGVEKIACENGLLIGCLSALKLYGLWVPFDRSTHFITAPNGSKPKISQCSLHRPRARTRLANHEIPTRAQSLVVPLQDAIEQALYYHEDETGLIILDSALNKGFINPYFADVAIANVQSHKRRVLNRYVTESQSGSETRVRNFLQSHNYKVQTQVFIDGIGRVDLLVGDSLIIECDSTTFHSQPLNVTTDRERDLQAHLHGFARIRLSYQQIWHQWEDTKKRLSMCLSTGLHRKPPRSLLDP